MSSLKPCLLLKLLVSAIVLSVVYSTIVLHMVIKELHSYATQLSIQAAMIQLEPEPAQTPEAAELVYEEPDIYDSASVEAVLIAKTIYGEARGISSITQQAGVGWCILNRVDGGYGDIHTVVTGGAFYGYDKSNPTIDGYGRDLCVLAADILNRWAMDKDGRVLPTGYYWFTGDGKNNYFRNEFNTRIHWDWSLPSPYES